MQTMQRLEIKINLIFNEAPIDSLAALAIKSTKIKTDILAICIFFSFLISSFLILLISDCAVFTSFIAITYS
jgi:hypothetical protein